MSTNASSIPCTLLSSVVVPLSIAGWRVARISTICHSTNHNINRGGGIGGYLQDRVTHPCRYTFQYMLHTIYGHRGNFGSSQLFLSKNRGNDSAESLHKKGKAFNAFKNKLETMNTLSTLHTLHSTADTKFPCNNGITV